MRIFLFALLFASCEAVTAEKGPPSKRYLDVNRICTVEEDGSGTFIRTDHSSSNYTVKRPVQQVLQEIAEARRWDGTGTGFIEVTD